MRFDKRILILTPTKLPAITGNAINTERWRRLLTMAGASVKVISTEGSIPEEIIKNIKAFNPHIIHCHHALKTGILFLENDFLEAKGNSSLVVSLPGTDINMGIKTHRDVILKVLNKARGILCQSRVIKEIAKSEFPHLKNRIYYIPRSVMWFGEETYNVREVAKCYNGDILFFHPAGVRPVKGNLECLELFQYLNKLNKKTKILFAGPILDEKYGRDFVKKIKDCSDFATWIPAISPEAMKSAYMGVDIVLNTSFSEGISTVLLEAMHLFKPILASDIPANRWLLSKNSPTEPCGLLYKVSTQRDFTEKALMLIDGSLIRERLFENLKERVKFMPKPEDELKHLIKIYELCFL